MKKKVFASVLSALMVTSSVSGSLMADSIEETDVSEEANVVIEEVEAEEEAVLETEEISDAESSEEAINEQLEESEEAQEDLVQEEALNVEEADEAEGEENNEGLVAPVYEEYEAPGTDALAATSITLKLGDKATGYLSDTDNDGLNDKLEIKGTGDLYDSISARSEFAYVENIYIEEGITSIGDNMFAGCRYLLEVSFPHTLTRIGDCAFKNSNLGYAVYIPESVKTIGDSAFESCSVSSVNFKDGLQTIGKNAFKECPFVTKIVLPNTVTSIGEGAFRRCEELREFGFSTKLSAIPDYCFCDCKKLVITEIPKNVKKIGAYAFRNCYEITELKIYDGLEYIGDYAFELIGVSSIYLPDTITHLGIGVFADVFRLKSVDIPKNITVIPDFLCGGCLSLENVTFRGEITGIGLCSFGGCTSLDDFVVPETVTHIEKNAFTIANINRLTIKGSNTTFGEYILAEGTVKELIIPCNQQNAIKESCYHEKIGKIVLTHTYNHSTDTKCNYCGATREVHLVTMDQFVERLYTTCLGRKSEAAGKDYWIKKLVNGTTGAEAARQFFFSSEFTNKKLSDREFITRLYKTFMDRNPDTAGMDYWLGRIKAGYTREKVFQGFINSQEWADMCLQYGILSGGTKTSTESKEPSKGCFEFATRLYTTCLGRKPDEAGLKDWVMKLARLKTTGTKAAHGFFFSKEFTSKNYSNEEYIKRLYRTFMGREADQGGINYWLGKIKSGYTREDVFQGFAKSAEFEKICIQYGILK